MRILYGVVGEGMGHATRSLVVVKHLLEVGHELRVVVSGHAKEFLAERLRGYRRVAIERITGLRFHYSDGRLDVAGTMGVNLCRAPTGIRRGIEVYRRIQQEKFEPQLVISDFESWSVLYALRHSLPVLSVDNQHVLTRCEHGEVLRSSRNRGSWMARAVVRTKVPRAYHYLITSFFFPPVRKPRTTLVPPILREEVLAAQREPRDHVLVYLRAMKEASLVAQLKKLPYRFYLYGLEAEGTEANVTFCPFSQHGFIEDLRTARALIGGGGFTLMSEAVSLRVPMLSVPIEGQFEQELNARYLERMGYGAHARRLDLQAMDSFLRSTDDIAQKLESYRREDNSLLFACLDELIERCARREPPGEQLASSARRH